MANKKRVSAPFNLTSPGTIFTLGFVALAIGMGILLTRGITPSSTLTDPGPNQGELIPITDTPAPGQQKGLQLKTIKFKQCTNKAAVGLLVDRSGSMRGTKMNDLKSALTTFTQGLGNQSVIGLTSFSSGDNGAIEVSEDVPFSRYQNVITQTAQAIQNLYPYGGTHTRTAFLFEKDKILAAQKQFPNNKFALIFLSDGIPETSPADCASGRQYGTGNYKRCFANSQDPTQNPDIAAEIKNAGIKIYSIALYVPTDPADQYFLPDMRRMMQKIASPNSYYEVPNTSDLKRIYQDISQKICNDIQ